MPSPPTGGPMPPPLTRMPRAVIPRVLLTAVLAAASPTPVAAQRTEIGDWFHVARTDSATLRNTSYVATLAVEGAGAMTVMCGALDLPVVAFLHPPLAGTEPEVRVQLFLKHDSVTTWHDGNVDSDRRSTLISHRDLALIRVRAREDDRIRVRIEAVDTTDAVELVLSARGLLDAVHRLDCVGLMRCDTLAVPPELLNRRETSEAMDDIYPRQLRRRGIRGMVNVWFLVDRSGRVTTPFINEPSRHERLNEAALKVTRIMRFSPASNGAEPIPVWVSLDLVFEDRTQWRWWPE